MDFDLVSLIQQCETVLAQGPNAEIQEILATLYLRLGEAYWGLANQNMRLPELRSCIDAWRRGLSLVPEKLDAYFLDIHHKLVAAHYWAGQERAGTERANLAIGLQEKAAAENPLGPLGIRFFQTRSGTLFQFGHLASEPEFFLKSKALGLVEDHIQPMLLAPEGKVRNRCLLDYWRRKGICVVTDPGLCARFSPLALPLEYNSFWIKTPIGKRIHLHLGSIVLQKAWEERGLPPLLQLTEDHIARARSCLKKLGMPDDAWWVAFHASDLPDPPNLRPGETFYWKCRGADIKTYKLAMDEVVERGGWVIRIGDSHMQPIEQNNHFIDLPHTEFNTDWMNIFIMGASRFLVGCDSGVNGVPSLFGIPFIRTNGCGTVGYPFSGHDLFIFKLRRSATSGCYLPLQDYCDPDTSICANLNVYNEKGQIFEDNSPEEIRSVVVEMFERLEGSLRYSQEDEALQARFRSTLEQVEPFTLTSRCGREFLRNHADILP